MSFEDLLNLTSSITRFTQSGALDDYGDPQTTSGTTSGISCKLDEDINTYIQDGKILNVKEYTYFCMPDVDIQLRDKVEISSKTYVITNVNLEYGRANVHHQEATIELMETNA